MAMETIRIVPGFDAEKTPTLNEAGVSDGQLIRWREGIPEKLGGWARFFPNPVGSIPRELHAWKDVNSNLRLAVGATAALKVITAGSIIDITPQTTTTNTAPNFSTVMNSATVTIIDSNISNVSTNNSVFIATPVSIGGIVLFGIYPIATVISSTTYTITAASAATSTVNNAGAVPSFGTVNGSAAVTVTLNNHGFTAGQSVAFLVPTTVNGVTISGAYLVQAPVTTNAFGITVNGLANATSSGSENGGNVQSVYYIAIGPQSPFSGWGVGPWGGGYLFTGTYNNGTGAVSLTTNFASGFSVGQSVTISNMTATGAGAAAVIAASNGVQVATGGTGGSTLNYSISAGLGLTTITGGAVGTGGWGTGTAPPSGAGTPIAATDWTLVNWGEILLGCPAGGGIYQWGPEGALQNASLVYQAPIMADGIELAQPQQILMAWGASNNGVPNAMRIAWSDAGNYTVWTPTSGNFAGGVTIPRGSTIVRVLQAPQQLLAWTDLGVWIGNYVGQPLVFAFTLVMEGCGLVGRKACGALGTTVYWMSAPLTAPSGVTVPGQFFQMAAGGAPAPMPCPVWDKVFQNLDIANASKVRFFANAEFNEIGWYFPSKSGGAGENDSYVKFNVVEGEWDYGPGNGTAPSTAIFGRSAWIDQSVLGPPIGGTVSGLIYQHEISPDMDGAPMNPYIVTGDFVMGKGEDFQFIDYMVPNFRYGKLGSPQTGTMLMTIFAKAFADDTPQSQGPYTVNIASPNFIEPRLRGRLASFRIESQDLGSFWRAGLIRYRVAPDGKNP